MQLGSYKIKESLVEDFNSMFCDYGEDLKDFVFELKNKIEDKVEVTYKMEFFDITSNLADSMTRVVRIDKVDWFENYFEKIEI